jgi:LEA14-like dessication related protein
MTAALRRVRLRLPAAVFAAAATFGLGACGALMPPPDLEAPALSFSDLSLDSVTRQRVLLTLTIAASNPNPIDIPLSDLHFDIALFGQRLAQGSVPQPRFTLPAKGTLAVPVSLSIATADLRSVMSRLVRGPSSEAVWELKGSARWGLSPLAIPFERRGDVQTLLKTLREPFGR